MVKKILHHIVQYPWIYEQVQLLAGREIVRHHLASQIALLDGNSRVILDLAGGTGAGRTFWKSSSFYICLDIDLIKLQAFHRRQTQEIALYANALNIPLKHSSSDIIMFINVSHHLPVESFEQLLKESVRVLRESGTFLFMDAVWEPNKLLSRLLWRYDRGSYPHTATCLRTAISKYYNIVDEQEFSVYHRYLLCRGVHVPVL